MAKRLTDPVQRFTSRFERSTPGECWEWTGSRLPSGYGMFWPFGRAGGKQYAHRFSYEFHRGPIPEGAQIDHLCKNTGCVNPDHLEAVDPLVNARRATGWLQNADGSWTCANGHSASDEAMGGRACKECFNAYRREWRAGKMRDAASDTYMAAWSRQKNMDNFVAEYPSLEREAQAVGLACVRARLRCGWAYDEDGWTDTRGRKVPYGFGPLRD